jgi:hypothetical protein
MVVAVAVLTFEAVNFGNRGDLIRLFLVFAAPYTLIRRPSAGRMIPVIAGAVAAIIAVLLFPYARDALHLGSDRSIAEAIRDSARAVDEMGDWSGDELFFASAALAGVRDLGTLEWGVRWTVPFMNFVPRQIWPEKHLFFGSMLLSAHDLAGMSGRISIADGSAYTGVLDGFFQIGWSCPVIWIVMGHFAGIRWRRVLAKPDIYEIGRYLAVFVGIVYWLTQDFRAAFYPWLFFNLPLWALMLTSCRPSEGRQSSLASIKMAAKMQPALKGGSHAHPRRLAPPGSLPPRPPPWGCRAFTGGRAADLDH